MDVGTQTKKLSKSNNSFDKSGKAKLTSINYLQLHTHTANKNCSETGRVLPINNNAVKTRTVDMIKQSTTTHRQCTLSTWHAANYSHYLPIWVLSTQVTWPKCELLKIEQEGVARAHKGTPTSYRWQNLHGKALSADNKKLLPKKQGFYHVS